jgi:hypothetical protein
MERLMLEEQMTPKERKEGVTRVTLGGGGPGGVEGRASSFRLVGWCVVESDMMLVVFLL